MKLKSMVIAALLCALVTVVTALAPISLGNLGYLNLGDAVILLATGFIGPLYMIFVAGIGSALADLLLGYSHYAFFTLLIKAMEGFVVAYLLQKMKFPVYLCYLVGIVIMTIAYATVDFLFFSSIAVFFNSLLANSIQGLLAYLAACLLLPLVKLSLGKMTHGTE